MSRRVFRKRKDCKESRYGGRSYIKRCRLARRRRVDGRSRIDMVVKDSLAALALYEKIFEVERLR